MIDLHTHMLSGLDDGAKTLAMSLDMARMAVDDGIGHVMCTPHSVPGLYPNRTTDIAPALERLRDALDAAGIGLWVGMGAEIHVAPEIVAQLQVGALPALNGGRYFLLELPGTLLPLGLDRLIEDSVAVGFIPILVHPERFGWIDRRPEWLSEMKRLGALLQVTAAAATGGMGKRAETRIRMMLDYDLVDVVASDAHDPVARPPRMSPAYRWMEAAYGPLRARRLFKETPMHILGLAPAARNAFTSAREAERL